MTHLNDAAREADVIARWQCLAEQRLDHLTELFESGRWRRFHDEASFLDNIKEAKVAVETWRSLAETRITIPSMQIAWPVPVRQTLPPAVEPPLAVAPEFAERAIIVREPEPAVAPERAEPTAVPEAIAVAEIKAVALDEAPVEMAIDMEALERALVTAEEVLDLAAIEKRYPLLHNAL